MTFNYDDSPEGYKRKDKNLETVEGKSPINTLGELRELLKDFPDDTVVANGIAAMWKQGQKPELPERRAHRILLIRQGLLANGRKYVCFMSGNEVTSKILSTGANLDKQ